MPVKLKKITKILKEKENTYNNNNFSNELVETFGKLDKEYR